jgi:DNA-binding XRE family transcriptional regulator
MENKTNKKPKLKLIPFSEIKAKWMKDPKFRKVHMENAFENGVWKAIVRFRCTQKISQEKLAKKIGVSQSTLYRFESGRTNPTLGFLKRVVSGLGLSVTVK